MQRKSTRSLLGSLALLALAASAQEPPAVTVTGGKIQGGTVTGGGAVFKGIPFAAPPVGDLRWREPMPVKPWTGTRDATHFGVRCMQSGADVSEDCLYINVWTPEWPIEIAQTGDVVDPRRRELRGCVLRSHFRRRKPWRNMEWCS